MSSKLVFAVHIGHNASAALMRDGVILSAALEERYCRIKNVVGYPQQAIDYLLKKHNVEGKDIDRIALTTVDRGGLMVKSATSTNFSLKDYDEYYGDRYFGPMFRGEDVSGYLKWLHRDPKFNKAPQHFDFSYLTDEVATDPKRDAELFRKESIRKLSSHLGVAPERVELIDHHTCHAHYAYFASPYRGKDCIALTMDGWGDGRNQTVWRVDSDQMTLIAESSQCDLARIYKMATLILGMRPDEHEFKVMGLAPYAKASYAARAMEPLEPLLRVDGMRVVHNNRPKDLYAYLRQGWRHHRFDNVAAAVQMYTETIASELVRNIARTTGISRFVVSGGVAMNIKMNKVIGELPEVHEMFVPGSGGDESLAIGGCYYLNREAGTNAPLASLYLGSDISDEMARFDWSSLDDRFVVKETKDPREIAGLLHAGDIVAVARGRAEFGARALGNRSILADPSKRESVQQINEAIKNRDFWMPFALSILEEGQDEYIANPKQFVSPFMSISLDAKPDRYKRVEAGTHPYDKTVRPQVVSRAVAPGYHALISAFCDLTGVPAILNTSFNLHGEPIVDSVADAIRTFELSGLDHVWIGESILISKRTRN